MSRKTEVEVDDVMEMEEDKPEVLYIRLCDRRPSGFIQDMNGVPAGTKGTEHHHEFDSPVARFIPNFGMRKGIKEETRNGNKVKTAYNEPIRYIKDQTEISVERQALLNIQRSRAAKEDMIEIKRGEFSVVREGSWIGLFDFIKQAFYNKSNTDRSGSRATAIYEEVEMGKEEEGLNEYDIYLADAIKFIGKFYQKTGKGYIYKEDKINALCELFAVYAETMAGKVTALNGTAKLNPEKFMIKAIKFEQTAFANVTHALQLKVIQIKDNLVYYTEKDKIMMNLGSGYMRPDQQIERISELLETPDFKAAKEEFMFELDLAKEKQLNK